MTMRPKHERGDIFRPLEKATGYQRVARLIDNEIVEGRLKPGDLLPTEHDLADMLGVHRSTVREGIRSLEHSGLITRAGRKRLAVTVPDPNLVARENTRALGLHQVSFLELWEVLLRLDPFSARLAAERATPEMRAALMANVAEMEANLGDDDAVIRADIAFHRLVSDAAGNAALSLAVAPVGALLFTASQDLYRTVPVARHRQLMAHRNIAEAVAAGAPDLAEEWMRRHIMDFRRGYDVGGLDPEAMIRLDHGAISSWN